MKKFRFVTLAALLSAATLYLTGCGEKAQTPIQRVEAKLNAGGCFYEVYDYTKFPPQFDFLLARVRPALEPLYAQLDVPLSLDELLAKAKEICKIAGLDRIEAGGQSSIVLYGSKEKLPYFFHNRGVLDTGLAPELPTFLMPLAGAPIALEAFAAAVPDNAAGAFTLNLDWVGLYRWINRNWPLPPAAIGALQGVTGCPPEEFFSGISGRVTAIYIDQNPRHPVASLQMPDQGNRLFALLAKLNLQDAECKEFSVPFPANLSQNVSGIGEVKLVKGDNVIVCYIGNGTKELIEKQLAAGKTFAKRADFAKLTARIPTSATAYGIADYTPMNPLDNNAIVTDNAQYVEVSACQVSAAGCVCYLNGYTDLQAALLKGVLSVIPQLQTIYDAFQPGGFEANGAEVIEDSEENRTRCSANLTALYEVCKAYQAKHDGKLPEAPGLTGLREIVKVAPPTLSPAILYCPTDSDTVPAEHFKNLKWLNTSYIYIGTLPDSIPAATRPLFTEVPAGGHANYAINILFADGHSEHIQLADNVDSMEKLMSFLHTDKHYSEAALNVLLERGKALDAMLEKELAEEWTEFSKSWE